jgi:hypothetical protein
MFIDHYVNLMQQVWVTLFWVYVAQQPLRHTPLNDDEVVSSILDAIWQWSTLASDQRLILIWLTFWLQPSSFPLMGLEHPSAEYEFTLDQFNLMEVKILLFLRDDHLTVQQKALLLEIALRLPQPISNWFLQITSERWK